MSLEVITTFYEHSYFIIYIYILNMLKFSSDNFGSKMWARERVGSSLNIPLSSNISHEKYKRKRYKERALT